MIFLMKRKAPEQEKWLRKVQRDLTAKLYPMSLSGVALSAWYN